MKVRMLLPTVAAIVIAASAVAQTTLHETGFEQNQEFQPGPLPDSGPDWKQKGTTPFEIAAKEDGTGQILECRTDSGDVSSRIWLTEMENSAEGQKTIVEFEIRATRSGAAGFQGNVHIGDFPAAPGIKMDGMAALLSLRGSGRVRTFDGDTEIEIGNWKDGEWMKFRIECDQAAKTFSVYQNDEILAADFAFPDNMLTDISSFGLTYYTGNDAPNPSALALDSLKISRQ